VQESITLKATDGVYSAARVVAHELEHQRLTKLALQGRDGDGDLVPDNQEKTSPFCFDQKITNTHDIAVDDGASGDSEVLAIEAESKSADRVKRELDWASPGSQSKK
jgi:hypothetical protein